MASTDPHVSHVALAWPNSCSATTTSLNGAMITVRHSRKMTTAYTPHSTHVIVCAVFQQWLSVQSG